MLQTLGSQVMQVLERVPFASIAEAGTTMPIFIGGAELRQAAQIEVCSARVKRLSNRNGSDNISKAQTILEQPWRQRLDGGLGGDSVDIMRQKQWHLNMS